MDNQYLQVGNITMNNIYFTTILTWAIISKIQNSLINLI